MSTEAETTVELAVELSCQKCVDKTNTVLSKAEKVSDFKVDLKTQSVLVTSSLPSTQLIDLIENKVGKKAVIMGTSGTQKDKVNLGAAVAMIGGVIGCGAVQGVVRFTQSDSETCIIDGTLDGLNPGEHGLAIHECGDISGGCSTVGDHYNPRNVRHGSPVDSQYNRHIGDLGNVKADDKGRAEFKFADKLVKVTDIIGRSIVVAEGSDDLGKGNQPMSKVNGNCGQLLSCGIIARSSGLFENAKRICACDGVSLWDERNKPLAGEGRKQENY